MTSGRENQETDDGIGQLQTSTNKGRNDTGNKEYGRQDTEGVKIDKSEIKHNTRSCSLNKPLQ